MHWFSKLMRGFFSPQKKVQVETKELEETVDTDEEVLEKTQPHPIPKSRFSPFASKILEKAREEFLNEDNEHTKASSPTQLFGPTKKEKED